MSNSKVYTKDEVMKIANNLIGKTFGELNNYQIQAELYDKGSHGHILEEDVFQYGSNSRSAPDFEEAGIELKVTPYKINKNGTLSAKERLVLNIINYMEEYKNTFYTSHFWYKNQLIEIVWYLHEDGKPKSEFKITDALLFSFPEEDLPIIKQDWYKIISKIKAGKAHEISEADTMYLGACTKGVNASSVRKQPFSDILAKQRAFCLKTSYMTQLVREYISGEHLERINKVVDEKKTFEDTLIDKLNPYKGKSVDELANYFGVKSNAKNLNELLVAKMLGIKGKISNTDEFVKANIVPKTIRVESNGKIKESMSFPTFKFTEIIKETWEDSELNEMFSTTKFMFAVFKENKNKYYFSGIKFWNMPVEILENDVKKVWEKTIDVIKTGNIVERIENGKRITNFPGMAENEYCHVRPHAQNSKDTYPLPVKDKVTGLESYTKQCFWLNSSYVIKIISE